MVCPACARAQLQHGADWLECRFCGRLYPIAAGIPVMVQDALPVRGPLLEPPAVRAVLAGLGLAADPVTSLRVRKASGARVQAPAGPHGIHTADGRILRRLLPYTVPPWDGQGTAAPQWLAEYLPRTMRPGQEVFASIRLCNAGTAPMLSAGEGRMTVAYAWSDLEDAPVFVEEARTPLLADLLPGACVTLPVRLRAPRRAGRYAVRLRMVQESVRWLEPAFGPFLVTVHATAGSPAASPRPVEPDARRLLARWLGSLAAPSVLEIGHGEAPMASGLVDGLVSVDDDLLALQFGRLCAAPAAVAVCAGLDQLPFPRHVFDAVVFFGTLHPMEDPAAALRQVSQHVRPGGFVGVFGEPSGQLAMAPGVLAGLRRGDNPQQFSLSEWQQVFARARLRAADLHADDVTLSARLVPDDGNA